MNKITTFFMFVFFSLQAFSQVANNEIQKRVPLGLNQGWYSSSTTFASVEWDCVNKALTNKCLVYHNDQWFTIKPESTGTYYINISNQSCKNLQGVQIVVLEGDPCKIDTYQLKICIPYTDQSDLFVRMDSLMAQTEYMINIDGYLADQCDFKIQFSTYGKGIPVQAQETKAIDLKLKPENSIINLKWAIPDSLFYQISQFRVYRKHDKEKAATLVDSVALIRNALGSTLPEYSVTDTLDREGLYIFSVYGIRSNGEISLLRKENFLYVLPQAYRNADQYKANIKYQMTGSSVVKVTVLNDSNDHYLFSTTRRTKKGKNTLMLDFAEYVEQGVYFFKIIITDKNKNQEFYYRVKRPVQSK